MKPYFEKTLAFKEFGAIIAELFGKEILKWNSN
jgi:hypothetical protein